MPRSSWGRFGPWLGVQQRASRPPSDYRCGDTTGPAAQYDDGELEFGEEFESMTASDCFAAGPFAFPVWSNRGLPQHCLYHRR